MFRNSEKSSLIYEPTPLQQNFSLTYFILLFFKFNVVFHTFVSYIYSGGGQGGGSPGEQGAGGVREAGEERAGGGISTMAGSGREIQKVKLFFCYCLLPV